VFCTCSSTVAQGLPGTHMTHLPFRLDQGKTALQPCY
jgi:hypothetical protein